MRGLSVVTTSEAPVTTSEAAVTTSEAAVAASKAAAVAESSMIFQFILEVLGDASVGSRVLRRSERGQVDERSNDREGSLHGGGWRGAKLEA